MISLKKLLTENTDPKQKVLEAADHVRSGLEKVFAAGNKEVTYRQCENVGLGYIKSISEAFKCALQESKKVAKTFGYRDDEASSKFIKEDNDFSKLDAQSPESAMAKKSSEEMPHDEKDMSNPEEKREVEIGRRLKTLASQAHGNRRNNSEGDVISKEIETLADELIKMHGAK